MVISGSSVLDVELLAVDDTDPDVGLQLDIKEIKNKSESIFFIRILFNNELIFRNKFQIQLNLRQFSVILI